MRENMRRTIRLVPTRLLLALLLPIVIASAAAPSSDKVAIERLGTHIILEVFDAPFALLNSTAVQLQALHEAVSSAGMTVVGELAHQFPVVGASSVLLISESHLSIHAWPERGYASVDLFTCGEAEELPCRAHEPVQYFQGTWRCANGSHVRMPTAAKLWTAINAIVVVIGAEGAMLTWMDRGLPSFAKSYKASAADIASPAPPQSLGWLEGLERDHVQVEL